MTSMPVLQYHPKKKKKRKENLRNHHNLEESKVTQLINVTWYPG